MSAKLLRILSALKGCEHRGLSTPVRTLRGAEIWRCELCGADVLYADDLDRL
jgi:hypothetical protein